MLDVDATGYFTKRLPAKRHLIADREQHGHIEDQRCIAEQHFDDAIAIRQRRELRKRDLDPDRTWPARVGRRRSELRRYGRAVRAQLGLRLGRRRVIGIERLEQITGLELECRL